jgi:hypothetical protein
MNKQNYHWEFGNGVGIDFNNRIGTGANNRPETKAGNVYTMEGCASVSDPDTGQLIFSTDGTVVVDATGTIKNPNFLLEGDASATSSAIIIPIFGKTDEFYIVTSGEAGSFGMAKYGDFISLSTALTFNQPPKVGINFYHINTSITTPSGDWVIAPAAVGNSPSGESVDVTNVTTEKLCLVANDTCDGFWLLSGWGRQIVVYQIDGDRSGINFHQRLRKTQTIEIAGYMKASHDGKHLVVCNYTQPRVPGSVLLYDFNRSTGTVSFRTDRPENILPTTTKDIFPDLRPYGADLRPYGAEFSPNNKFLYFSLCKDKLPGVIIQVDLSGTVLTSVEISNQNFANTDLLPDTVALQASILNEPLQHRLLSPSLVHVTRGVGAMLLGPDNVIYVACPGYQKLGAIVAPNEYQPPSSTNNECGFTNNYIDFSDQTTPHRICFWGLPTLVQNATCGGDPTPSCEDLNTDVNQLLLDRCVDKHHTLEHCDEANDCECDPSDTCEPVALPELKPCISIRWGASDCDGIESDDVEIMCITICNCHSNISFSNLSIASLTVVDANGNDVPLLPDGTPSVQLVPVGPYNFGKIEPCSCVSREFVFRSRGAISGPYHIKLAGICYDVCLHYDMEDCFVLNMCED